MLSSFSKMERSVGSGSRVFSAKEQLQRKRPSRVQLDSQHLFQQSLKLNNELNRLLEENRQFKEGLNKVDSIRNYKQGLIFSVQNIIKQKSKDLKNETKSSSWLVYNLKKKINHMNKQLEIKQKQIQDFNSSKIALILKQKEAQVKLLESLADKHIRDQIPVDNQILDELIEMKLYSELQSQYILQLNSNISIQKLNIKKILEEISVDKKEVDIKRQQLENSKKIQEMSRMQRQMQMIQMESEDGGENQDMHEELQMTRKLQADQIKDLEMKIDKIVERENAQKKRLQTRIEQLKSRVLSHQIKASQQFKQPSVQQIKESQSLKNSQNEESQVEKPHKLVMELKLKDVSDIGQNLRFRLSIKRLSHSSWKPLIYSEEDQKTISIRQLVPILQNEPFGVDHENSVKLSRYLVQESTGKYFYDQNLRQDIPIVKSILQKLICNLIVYSEEQEAALSASVGEVTQKYHLLLVGGLETKTNKRDYVDKSLILPVFDACSMEFTPNQMEYIAFYLYGHSESLDKLMYRNLVKIGVQPIKYRE